MIRDPWINSKNFDLAFIIGPGLLSALVVLLLNYSGFAPTNISTLTWLILVVMIDVAHVWSTLFRTYLNRENIKKHRRAFMVVPLICYLTGVILHSMSGAIFWRVMAYLAVFHFIRQQYGFFRLYAPKGQSQKSEFFSKFVIYSATVIPLIIWHFSGEQSFHWFMKGDFFYLHSKSLASFLSTLGPCLYILYFLLEVFSFKRSLFLPHNLFLLGTILSWWTGIVWLKTDWAFTVTNIISHGIPYFALIYISDMKERKKLFWPSKLPVFIMFSGLIVLGYIEEASWAFFIWRENLSIFPELSSLAAITDSALLALVVPLLALPQLTHYILDGIIWKKVG